MPLFTSAKKPSCVCGPRLCLESLEIRDTPARITWINASSGDWSVPSNWSLNRIPDVDDDAVVTTPGVTITHSSGIDIVKSLVSNGTIEQLGGTLSFSSASSVRNFRLSGGSLAGSGNLTINNLMTWTGGNMTGTGTTILPVGSTADFSGSTLTFSRTIDNYGSTTFSGTFLYFGSQDGEVGIFNNRHGGLFEIPDYPAVLMPDPNVGYLPAMLFNNEGDFVSHSSIQQAHFLSVDFKNSGKVDVQSSILAVVENFTNSGIIAVATGATIIFGGGTTRIDSGTSFLVSGSVIIQDDLRSRTTESFLVESDVVLTNVTMMSGVLGGNGTARMAGVFNWTGGSMNGSGVTVLTAGSSGRLQGSLNRTLNNFGQFSFGHLLFNTENGVPAVFTNEVGGSLTTETQAAISQFHPVGNVFNNHGTLHVTSTTEVDIPFFNSGLVDSGSLLVLSEGGSSTGTITGDGALEFTKGLFTFTSGVYSATSIRPSSSMYENSFATVVFGPGSSLNTFEINCIGGTLILNTGQVVTVPSLYLGILNAKYANLAGSDTLVISSTLTWQGGFMSGSGKTVLAANALADTPINTAFMGLDRRFENYGTFNYSATSLKFNLNGDTAGTFVNEAGAIFNHSGVFAEEHVGGSRFENRGTFNALHAFAGNVVSVVVPFVNSGVVNVTTGTLEFSSGGRNTGHITVVSGSHLVLRAGEYVFQDGTLLAGTGSLDVLPVASLTIQDSTLLATRITTTINNAGSFSIENSRTIFEVDGLESGAFNNLAGGYVSISNSILAINATSAAVTFNNIGTLFSTGTVVVELLFQNAGIVQIVSGTTTISRGDIQVNNSQSLTIAPDAALHISGRLIGTTQDANLFNPLGEVVFDKAVDSGSGQTIEAMSQDAGDVGVGFHHNFAYGSITLKPDVHVILQDDFRNSADHFPEAVYVHQLSVQEGATLDLNGIHLYTLIADIRGTVLNGDVTIVPTSLHFLQQPVGGPVGTSPGTVRVLWVFQDGSFVDRKASVLLSADSEPSQYHVTAIADTVHGIAEFASFNLGATGVYRLSAAIDDIAHVFSDAFTITEAIPSSKGKPVAQNQANTFSISGASTANLFNLDGSLGSIDQVPNSPILRVITTDINGDGSSDSVVVTGPGASVQVIRIDGKSGTQTSFTPYESTFTGGAFVSAADVNGDGVADLAVSADVGGGPRIVIFDGVTGDRLADFFGIDDTNFRGGTRSALSDINGDGVADLVLGAGIGGGPRVAIFDGKTLRPGVTPVRLLPDFFVFESSLRDGVYVSAGDIDGDGVSDLVFGSGLGGAPRVRIFSGSGFLTNNVYNPVIADFFADATTNQKGARVVVKNLDNDPYADLIIGVPLESDASVVKTFLGKDLRTGNTTPSSSFDPAVTGDIFVG